MASDCSLKNAAGKPVKFYETTLPENHEWNSTFVCETAEAMMEESLKEGIIVVEEFCEGADMLASELGNGSYDTALEIVSALPDDTQGKQDGLVRLIKCKTEESRSTLIAESALGINIYSVGTAKINGSECPAFITQVSNSFSTAYWLNGAGKCSGFKHDNPAGKGKDNAQSTELRQVFSYNGELPSEYIYNKKVFQY